ncbi:MAG: hypothetical protein WEC00_14340, partial [Dongiaceae bacterium]
MSVPYFLGLSGSFGRFAQPKSPHKRRESYLIIHSLHYENWGFPLSLTNRDVARISELARLELTPAE